MRTAETQSTQSERASTVPPTAGQSLRGYFLVTGAALCWGLSGALAKFLFVRRVEPLVLAQTRSSFAFLMLVAYAAAARRDLLRIAWRDALGLAALGIGGIAVSNYTYFEAIHRTNVTTGILVQYTAPVWVMLYAVLFTGERLTAAKVTAVVLSFGGCLLAVGGYDPAVLRLNALGIGFALVAAFSFGFFNVWGGRMAARVNLRSSMIYSLGAATVFWLSINPPGRLLAAVSGAGQWMTFLAYSLVSILAPFSLYYAGLKRLSPTRAVITSSLEPFFAIFFAFLLVGERVPALNLLGGVAVVGAVVLMHRRG